MSTTTWMKKFYKSMETAKNWSDLKCFKHTLKKYQGTLPKNLKEHQVSLFEGDIIYKKCPDFSFLASSCSLCEKYYNEKLKVSCSKCPIYKETRKDCGDLGTPYESFVNDNDPKPMIDLMKVLIKKCDPEGNYKK